MTEKRRGFEVESIRRLPPSSGESIQSADSDASDGSGPEENYSQPSSHPGSEASPGNEQGLAIADKLSVEDSNLVADSGSVPNEQVDSINSDESNSEVKIKIEERRMVNAWFTQRGEGEVQPQFEGLQDKLGSVSSPRSEDCEDIIYNLIVSVKAPQTVRAIQAIAHRLTQDSTILFLQNGMGVIDEVNQKVFPDEKYRPTYVVGVVTHGLYSTRNFSVIHAGEGTIALGAMPRAPMKKFTEREPLAQLAASARYILRTMTRTPVFVAVGFPPTDLFQQQLDKLAVNCIINPLTALFDCKNGFLLSNFHFTRVMRLLLAEISLVIRSLPELKNVPNVNMRFDSLRLERMVVSVASTTANNNSSMLQDLRAGKSTEIDYINGYIIKRGEEMGVHCVMNYMLMHMIKAKRKNSREQANLLPFAG